MSALTKLFVVLLVVCSLLLSAATVVFVNQTQNYKLAMDNFNTRIGKLEREKSLLDEQNRTLRAEAATAIKDKNDYSAAKQKELNDLLAQNETAKNEISKLEAQIKLHVASVDSLTVAVKSKDEKYDGQEKRYLAARKEADDYRGKYFDSQTSNTDLNKRLEEALRDWRWNVEKVHQLEADIERAKTVLADHRIPWDTKPKVGDVPDVRGVVTEIKQQDGLVYATISLGQADKIAKGMKFTVVDPSVRDFLAYLTVDVVEQNEALGRLEGPRVGDVKANCQVLSKIDNR